MTRRTFFRKGLRSRGGMSRTMTATFTLFVN
jgi:hypothetical protein